MTTESADLLREQVRERYAQAARAVGTGSIATCGDGSCCNGKATDFGEGLYSAAQRDEIPIRPRSHRSAAETRRLSPTFAKARSSSTLDRAAGST